MKTISTSAYIKIHRLQLHPPQRQRLHAQFDWLGTSRDDAAGRSFCGVRCGHTQEKALWGKYWTIQDVLNFWTWFNMFQPCFNMFQPWMFGALFSDTVTCFLMTMCLLAMWKRHELRTYLCSVLNVFGGARVFQKMLHDEPASWTQFLLGKPNNKHW